MISKILQNLGLQSSESRVTLISIFAIKDAIKLVKLQMKKKYNFFKLDMFKVKLSRKNKNKSLKVRYPQKNIGIFPLHKECAAY